MKKGMNAVLGVSGIVFLLIVVVVYMFVPTVQGFAYQVAFVFSILTILLVYGGIWVSQLLSARTGSKSIGTAGQLLIVYGVLSLAMNAYFAFSVKERGVLLLVLDILLTLLFSVLTFFSLWISKNTPTIRTTRWDADNPVLQIIERVGELREDPQNELFYPQLARIYDRLLFLDTTVIRPQDEALELTLRELEVQMQSKEDDREELVEEKTQELILVLREREDELRKLRADSKRNSS
ncbi:MAG TPA: hypothetical protein GX733_05770 [Tissierellia bacterium]|nr:hypothetical protein [Tissierellia bacterium]